jgi:hypothetical protein
VLAQVWESEHDHPLLREGSWADESHRRDHRALHGSLDAGPPQEGSFEAGRLQVGNTRNDKMNPYLAGSISFA